VACPKAHAGAPSATIFSEAFESAREDLVVIDRGHRILAANASARRHAERAIGRAIVVGDDMRLFLAPGAEVDYHANFSRALAGESVTVERSVTFANGEAFDASFAYRPVRVDGAVVGVSFGAMALADLPTRQRVALLERALAAAPLSFLIADARRPDFPIVHASGAVARLTGYEPSEVVGRNARMFRAPETDDASLASVRDALRTGTSCDVVMRNVDKAGKTYWARLVLVPLRDDAGELTHFVGIQQDASGLVAIAEGFDAVTDAAVRDEILDGIVHDLRNDFMALAGHLDLIGSADRDEQLEDVDAAKGALKHAAGMLALLRSPTGSPSARKDNLLRALVDEVLVLARRLFPPRVEIELDPGDEPARVNVEAHAFVRVLLNVLINARDALRGRSGLVHLAVHRGRVTEAGEPEIEPIPGYFTVTVDDTGPGMSSAVLARAFEAGFTTKAERQGSGLGLPTSLATVRSFGGAMRIRSREGHGTRVYISVPAAKDVRAHPGATPSHGLEVLLLESNTRVRAIIAALLKRRGAAIESVGDVAVARRIEKNFAPASVLVLSPSVPDADAFLASWLAAFPERRAIVVAGSRKGAPLEDGRTYGLPLPFDHDELLRALAYLGRPN
jgi:PAS domain S-box-containing protein